MQGAGPFTGWPFGADRWFWLDVAEDAGDASDADMKRTTMTDQTGKKMDETVRRQRLQGPKVSPKVQCHRRYAADDHQRLSGASIPFEAQYRASR